MYLNMSRIFKFFSFSRPDNFRSWVSNKIYLQFHSICLSYLNKHPDTVLIVLHRYFSEGIFPRATSQVTISQVAIFQMYNFQNVQSPKRQLPKGWLRPSEAPQAAIGGRAMRLRWAWLPSAAAKIGWGPITFGKLPLGKNPLEKFLTSSIYGQGLGWVKYVSMVKG